MKAVIFDMDGVLCELNHEVRLAELSRLTGISGPAIHSAIWESGFESASDAGLMTADKYLQGFGERIGYPLTEAQWVEGRRAGMQVLSATIDLAKELSGRLPVGMLTNNGLLLKRTLGALMPEVLEIFGPRAFVSAELRVCKPAPESYLAVCMQMGVTPSDTLMVDDREENVAGAIAAGLLGHAFSGAEGLRKIAGR